MTSPKIKGIVYDIETAANLGLYFGRPYEVNIAKLVQEGYVFGFAYKWLGERKTYSCYIWDFPLYKKEPRNDINVVKRWRELMEAAELVIGHNSDTFDNKVMMGRLMKHRLPPIQLPPSFDTKKKIKQVARIDSNKLDDLGEYFGIGRKRKHDGIEMWWDCMQGVVKAQREMVAYNIQDTRLTEKLYLLERSYAQTHPNMANNDGKPSACPTCLSERPLHSMGYKITASGTRYRRFQCQDCGRYCNERSQIKGAEKSQYV